jgi:hypothetical protein
MKLKNNVLILCIVGFSSNIWCAAFPEDKAKKPIVVSLAGRECHVVNGELKLVDSKRPFDVRYDAAQDKFINPKDSFYFWKDVFFHGACAGGLIGFFVQGVFTTTQVFGQDTKASGGLVGAVITWAVLGLCFNVCMKQE